MVHMSCMFHLHLTCSSRVCKCVRISRNYHFSVLLGPFFGVTPSDAVQPRPQSNFKKIAKRCAGDEDG